MSDHETVPLGLDQETRTRLDELADVLIPGGAGLPAASNVSLGLDLIDRVLHANPDLVTPIRLVAQLKGTPEKVLREIREDRPAVYTDFVLAVAGAYFMAPAVRKNLGYPGHAPRKAAAPDDEAAFYLEDGVLEPVIARGSIYRDASGG